MTKLSHDKVWNKFKDIKGIKQLLESALLLYSLLIDADTPKWLKSIAIAALLYLITPIDVIPDFIPIEGLIDDLAVLTAAISSIKSHIKPHHKTQANDLFNQL